MKIPHEFELMGQTIKVKFVNELLQESDTLGQACYRTGEIKILENSPAFKVTKEKQMRVFLHELMHWIFYKLKKDDLCNDEDLVDMVADLLMQTLKTMKV
jgi:predicted SprT family Zn-dependent metalloprotease